MIESGLQWLRDKAPAVAGTDVAYTPQGGTPINITAVLGSELDDVVEAEGGAMVHAVLVDLLVDPAELTDGGSAFKPQAGDTATYTDASGETRTLQVMERDTEEAWRWADPHRARLRIFTREVDA